MSKLVFKFDWEDPQGARGAELRATWARLELSVGGRPVTRVIDQRSNGIRDGVYLPLYPLAEWLATHWWSLLHEVEAPGKTSEREYGRRHNMRGAGEGFALPAVSFVPTGEFVRIEWSPLLLQKQRVEFTGTGSDIVTIGDFRTAVFEFVEAVTRRLRECSIESTLLQADVEALSSASPDEERFCAASGALGLDPYSLDDIQRNAIVSAAEVVPPHLLLEFLSAIKFDDISDRTAQLLRALAAAQSNTANLRELKQLRRELRPAGPQIEPYPWSQGYRLARRLREQLDIDGQRLRTVAELGQALGATETEFRRALAPLGVAKGPFDLIMDVNQNGSPGFAVNQGPSQTFSLCRGLFEFLTSPEGGPQVATRAKSDHQKRNRAFAAEFLAPATDIKAMLPGDRISAEDLDELAAEFGVSSYVISHQIANHQLATVLT